MGSNKNTDKLIYKTEIDPLHRKQRSHTHRNQRKAERDKLGLTYI